MIKLSGISKSFGGQTILRGVDWFVGPHDRVALIGENGSGKTTLLRIVADLERPDDGTLEIPRNLRVGYLAQTGFVIGEGTVREEARRAFAEVLALQEEQAELERRLERVQPGDAGIERLTIRHSEVIERLSILGAEEIERRVGQVLTGLGFRQRDFDRPVGDLSGGWQMRAALARLLLQRPQILLLDEPTNHLDLEAREWLEGYLRDYPYAFAVVSHDRYFLDVTVGRVTEIVGHQLEEYAGNYSFYLSEREKRLARRQKAYERQQQEIRRIQRFIDTYRSDKRRASLVQSRLKMLSKMERLEPPQPYRKSITIRYPSCPHSGKVVLELCDVRKSYGALTVFSGAHLRLLRGQRVALVGPNGAGKSTLMRLLAGQETPDGGRREEGYRVRPAFFAQEQGFRLDRRRTVLETVTALAPNDFIPQVRSLLGAFLFTGDAVDKRVGVLSGGEVNRLALACLLVRPSNLLLLDEPTNHLDIPSKEVLLTALREYPGTVVFVSHDRHFLDALAQQIAVVGRGGVREYPGTYTEYLWAREHGSAADAPPAPRATPGGEAERSPGRTSPAASMHGRGGRAPRQDRAGAAMPHSPGRGRDELAGAPRESLGELERRIARLEARQTQLAQAMAAPDFFANPDRARAYQQQYAEVEQALGRLYRRWESAADRGAEGP
ncbi:MAG: ATP-binding cassette domain-containing protein [Candidatus Eisenbacteria bacterium]|nr:ATP-binding cassette domain-containing protein [Candidatus Eisenbacteria bacterium]